ncbi:MAG: transglutaminase domain-containing protein, partial [Stenotrophomonas sp.]
MDPVVRKPRSLHHIAWRTAACLLLAAPSAWAQPVAPLPQVIAAIDHGDFAAADADIAKAIVDPSVGPYLRDDYAFQRERMRRMRLDFSLDEAGAKALLRKQIPDLRDDEFARWEAAGLLEHLDIDGQRRYFKRAPSNLFRLSAEARARRAPGVPLPVDGPYENLAPHHREVIAAAKA